MSAEAIRLAEVVPLGWAWATALAVSALAAAPIYRMLRSIGSRQTVSEYVPEHAQKQGTPTMGGLIILAGLLGAQINQTLSGNSSLAFAAVVTLGFALVGFLDDFLIPRLDPTKRGLGWIPKLVLQGVAACPAPLFGALSSDSSSAIGVALLQVFVILFFVNAFNFADGMDGLAGGLLLILSLGAVVIGLASGALLSAVLGAALAGAVIPFLFLNSPPARVFMGDVGSLPLGGLLGWIAIDLYVHLERSASGWLPAAAVLGLWSLVLVAELVPVPIQILSVKLLKRRVFPKTPIHHAFESAGIPETRIVWGFHLIQAILVLAACFLAVGTIAGGKA